MKQIHQKKKVGGDFDTVKNVITMRGSKQDVEKFIAFLKRDGRKDLDFNSFLPVPDALDNNVTTGDKALAIGEYLVDGTCHLMDKETCGRTVTDDMLQFLDFNYNGRVFDTKEEIMKAYIAGIKEKRNISEDKFSKKLNDYVKAYQNLKRFGYPDRDSWCMANWGAESGAMSSTPLDNLYPAYDESSNAWSVSFEFLTYNLPENILKRVAKYFPSLSGTDEFAGEEYCTHTGTIYFSEGYYRIEKFRDFSYDAFCHSLTVWNVEELLDFVNITRQKSPTS